MAKALIPLIAIHYDNKGQILSEKHYTCLEEFLVEKGAEESKDTIIDELEDYGYARFQHHLLTHSTPH